MRTPVGKVPSYLNYFGNTSTSVDMEIAQAQFSTLTIESWLVKTLALCVRTFFALLSLIFHMRQANIP